MLGSIILFAITYVLIASEKLDKTAAALLGASAAIFLGLVPHEEALAAVDLNVVFLLMGMMVVVNILAGTGLFEWVAVTIARRARGDGMRRTTVILIAPITILICEILELNVVPFLILEAIASNIGGTATLIGDPPNVLIASATGLSFNDFILHLSPAVVLIMAIGLPVAALLFRGSTRVRPECQDRLLAARPDKAILEPERLKRALVVFGLMLLAFFASHSLHIEPGIIAISGALIMAIVCGVDLHHALEKVEWNSIFFFIGLFMLIGALEHNHVFESLGVLILEVTSGNLAATALTVLWFSAIASAIVDNIPLVIAMIPLIKSIVPVFAQQLGLSDAEAIRLQIEEPLYWSLALGACLGGNGSLVGASANVVIAQIARRNRYDFTFWGFTRLGLPTMLGSTAIASVYVYLRYLQ
jgi:Na+/H+ antiporter NhaD/arsenite permease-like protein